MFICNEILHTKVKENMPATLQTSDRTRLSVMDVSLYSEAHLNYQAGFLAYSSNARLSFSQNGYCNGF